MVALITSVHRLEFFPSGYYSKLKKSTCQPNRGNLLTHSLTPLLTHSLYYNRQATLWKLIILLPETETHERVKYQCKEAWALSAKRSEPDKLQECREWSGTTETVSKEGNINLQPVN